MWVSVNILRLLPPASTMCFKIKNKVILQKLEELKSDPGSIIVQAILSPRPSVAQWTQGHKYSTDQAEHFQLQGTMVTVKEKKPPQSNKTNSITKCYNRRIKNNRATILISQSSRHVNYWNTLGAKPCCHQSEEQSNLRKPFRLSTLTTSQCLLNQHGQSMPPKSTSRYLCQARVPLHGISAAHW